MTIKKASRSMPLSTKHFQAARLSAGASATSQIRAAHARHRSSKMMGSGMKAKPVK